MKVYDFIDKDLGKAIPYGVYDIGKNEGWVSVGISHDTASFAVSTIRSWWYEMGEEKFSKSNRVFITADGGGSNSSRSRLWKIELQVLADEIGKEITVSHFPPGTSKWNKIEHRLFSHITMNWRARPLTNIQLVVDLIASTKTSKGLKVKSKLDSSVYEKGIKISDNELSGINLQKDDFTSSCRWLPLPRFRFFRSFSGVAISKKPSSNSIIPVSGYRSSLLPIKVLIRCIRDQTVLYLLYPSYRCISQAEIPFLVAVINKIARYQVLNDRLECSMTVPLLKVVRK